MTTSTTCMLFEMLLKEIIIFSVASFLSSVFSRHRNRTRPYDLFVSTLSYSVFVSRFTANLTRNCSQLNYLNL